jgi:hypothetical protein
MKTNKTSPTQAVESTREAGSWQKAIQAFKEKGSPLQVRLDVSGGLKGKAYKLSMGLTEEGSLQGHWDCRVRDKKAEISSKVDRKRLLELVSLMEETRLFEHTQPNPSFLPDTVVGKLTISIGGQTLVFYYPADERQMGKQAEPLHPGLKRITDWLYAQGAKAVKAKNIKP